MGRPKAMPKDMFGNELKIGEKIMYITGSHGFTTLNFAEILDITHRDTVSNRYMPHIPYTIKASKYAEHHGWAEELPKIVYLTSPHALKVGNKIPERP